MKPDLSSDDLAFIDRLRQGVVKAGTQSSLADEAGLNRPMISKYLNGSEPGRAALVSLANAMKVPVGWLVAGEGSATSGPLIAPAVVGAGGDYIPIHENRATGHGSTSRRGLVSIGIICFIRRDVAEKLFPAANLASLAGFQVEDSGPFRDLGKGDWIIVDTSRRELFPGVGAFRIGNKLVTCAVNLLEAKPGRAPLYRINMQFCEEPTGSLCITTEDLGEHIDLIGEVVFPGRLYVDHQFSAP